MKKLLVLLLALIFLSGCAAKEPPIPQPIYGNAPQLSEKGITVNGTALSGIYLQEEVEYIRMAEFAAAIGETFTVTEGIETHTAALSNPIAAINFSTAPQPPEDACTLYLCESIYDGTDWYHPLEAVLKLFRFHLLEDQERNHRYYTSYPTAESIEEGYRVPTLMYHAVSDQCWGIQSLFVSPSELDKQLQYLAENGYTPITFEDLSRVSEIEKPILLTFDDGYDDNYTELFPLLKKYNMKATVFMIMGSVGREHYLTAEQIKEMDASGLVSFQSHTMSHPDLDSCNAEQLEYELHQSKLELARLIGKEPFVLCYPTGKYSSASLEVTEKYYQFGLLMSGKIYETGSNPLKITRRYISRSTTLSSFASMIK